jgi:hypothetical protein
MSEPTLILSTLYIVLSLTFLMIVISLNITESILIYQGLDEKSDKYAIVDNVAFNFSTIHYSFMFGTFFFDMYKWMIFIISSEDLEKSVYESENGKSREAVKIERRTQRLNIFLVVAQIILKLSFLTIIIGCIFAIYQQDTYERKTLLEMWIKIRSILVIILAGCFLVIYLTNFFVLRSRLIRFFPSFYQLEKSRIITLNVCIILSIIGRLAFNILLTQ